MCSTYLHFYAAISYEAIGRALHDLSGTKIPSLVQAKESYKAAAASLLLAKKSSASGGWDDDAIFESPISSDKPWFQSPIKSRIAQYQCVSPTLSSRFHFRSVRASRDSLEPSPLHIHKNLQIHSFPITPPRTKPARGHQEHHDQYPPQTPPSKIRGGTSSSSNHRLSVTFSASSYTWLHNRSLERYNTHITEFADMLQGHIAAVQHAIANVTDIQPNGHGKRLASLGAIPEARAADLRARIVRLKAHGWKRKRFAPERYQGLCSKALDEL